MLFDDTVDLRQILLRIASFFRHETCGQCVPCRVGVVRQQETLQRLVSAKPLGSTAQEIAMLREMAQAMRDASICGSWPDSLQRAGVRDAAMESIRMSSIVYGLRNRSTLRSLRFLCRAAPFRKRRPSANAALIEIKIDGNPVSVAEGSTILDAAKKLGIDTPTLCFLESLTPLMSVASVWWSWTGSRTLVPACSRKVEPNMSIKTDSERVRLSRRLVLEFLASSVDLSTAPAMQEYMEPLRRAS